MYVFMFTLSCACVSVSGVLFSVGVCVCDLLICLHGERDITNSPFRAQQAEVAAARAAVRARAAAGRYIHIVYTYICIDVFMYT